MKKIYSAFVLLEALCFNAGVYGQSNITVVAPVGNNYSQNVAPTGSQSYMKGCFLITASELAGLTGSSITSFGFSLYYGPTNTVSGNMTVYMQNTSDIYYSKGTNYTSALSGMTSVYNSNMTVPSAGSNIMLSLPSSFNYTGGGIYVAYSWTATSPLDNTGAFYNSNTPPSFSNMGAYVNYSSNYLSSSTDRPVCLIGMINTATNEAGVLYINALGTAAEAIQSPQAITADIKNESINALTNVNVSLNVSGSTVFSDSQVISSIAAGAVETVTFLPFNPTALGTNTLVVSIPSDQNPQNNVYMWTQSVTCNRASNMPAGDFSNSIQSYGFTGNGGGIFCTVYNFSDTTNLQALGLIVADDTYPVYGVLLDNTGNILATTNTITPNGSQLGTSVTFSFSHGQSLTANTDYYMGMVQPLGGYYPMGALQVIGSGTGNRFFSCSLNGGNFSPDQNNVYFGIDAILAGPHISVTQASTVICTGESMILAANGASSYTWNASVFNPIDTPNNGTITVTPTSNELYQLYAIDDAGCSGSATAPLRVVACTGLAVNAAKEELKLYPNPTVGGKTTISGLSGPATISVYNMLGALVITQSTSDEKTTLDMTGLAPGNYMVRITDSANPSKTVKFVNEH